MSTDAADRVLGSWIVGCLGLACGAPVQDAEVTGPAPVAVAAPSEPKEPANDLPANDLPANDLPANDLAEWYAGPPGVEERLMAVDSLEVLSIDPSDWDQHDPKHFRRYGVLGSVQVTDPAQRDTIVRELFRNFHTETKFRVGAPYCFVPRVGLRATDAQGTIDLVICYECSQMLSYTGAEHTSHLMIHGFGRKELRETLMRARIELATEHDFYSPELDVRFELVSAPGPRALADFERGAAAALRGCFLKDYETGGGEPAVFTASVQVARHGRITVDKIEELDPELDLGRCVAKALTRLRLAKAKADAQLEVRVSMRLRPPKGWPPKVAD
jgi:hypothetical protein